MNLLAAALTLGLVAALGSGAAAQGTRPHEGVFVIHDFRFHDGRVLPELKQHYVTLGAPTGEPVLVLHGTAGSAQGMLGPGFGGALFGPGQPLDAATHYIIVPDAIGAGGSSKPSDGLRMAFPRYDYADMVQAQHRLLTEGLGLKHLKLVIGNSMGGMLTWQWGEAYPDFMDALVPLASQPVQVAGRNWIARRMLVDTIKADPAWNGGDYTAQPPAFGRAMAYFGLMTSGGEKGLYEAAPTWAEADALAAELIARAPGGDANDVIYQFEAARDYDPEPHLDRIKGRVLAINSADDERNPAALGVMEPLIGRLRDGRLYLIPIGPRSRGHATTGDAALWRDQLVAFLKGR